MKSLIFKKNGKIKKGYEHLLTPLFGTSTGLPMSISVLAGPVWPQMIVYDVYDSDWKKPNWAGPFFTVSVDDTPTVLNGNNRAISKTDVLKVSAYIKKNKSVLLKHWIGEYDSFDLVNHLHKLDSR